MPAGKKRARTTESPKKDKPVDVEELKKTDETPHPAAGVSDLRLPAKWKTDPQLISMLVSKKAETLIPSDGRIFIAQRTDKITDVWKGLIRHNFLSVPVLQKTGSKYYGFIDLADIVMFVVNLFGSTKLNVEADFWELYGKEEILANKTVNDIMIYPLQKRNPFHPISRGYSLFSAVELLARERELHRVPVIDQSRRLVNLPTQSQLVRYLAENLDKFGEVKNKPVSAFFNIARDVYSVKEDSIALDAFQTMISHNVSGLAVVNADGKLMSNISLRDLKAISNDGRLFWRLYQTVKNFLLKIKKEYQEQDHRPHLIVTVTPDDTLEQTIRKLAENSIHRIYVVDDARKPVGLISLKDILAELIDSV